MEKETKTEAELKLTDEAAEAPATPEVATSAAVTSPALPEENGHQPEPAAPAWTDEDDFAVEERAIQASDASSAVAPYDDGGNSLEQIRKIAPWVTLALFIVFPNFLTLGLLVVALALHSSRFLQIVRALKLEQWGFVAITLLGTGLRFWDLGLKPLHHDESMHAYFSWQLFLDPASYQYNPLLHGPFQFHAIAYVYYVASHLNVSDGGVNDVTARTAAAILGSAMIPMCYFLRERIGKAGALAAAFLLAVSPIFVYYSRFTREDIYFASFTFATVVAFFKFCEQRRLRWFLACVAAFVLAYASKEAAFFNIAIFGGLLVGFVVWELGSRYVYPAARRRAQTSPRPSPTPLERELEDEEEQEPQSRRLPLGLNTHAGALAVLLYLALGGIFAKLVLSRVAQLSAYLSAAELSNSANPPSLQYITQVAQGRLDQASATVQNIENIVVNVLLLGLVLVAVVVLVVVIWQLFHEPYAAAPDAADQRRGLARWVDPVRQPLLNGLVRIPWSYWFFALLVAFVIFAGLFWIVPAIGNPNCADGVGLGYQLKYYYVDGTVGTNPTGTVCTWSQGFHAGIGDGLVQGVFYWITQQQVARGGQPWYYYLLLIPMYEQLAVIFGIGGLIRCLARPNRFRLFVAFWFIASLFLYSWAGEKMPWLALHILLPLLLLAGIALDWALAKMLEMLDELAHNRLTTGSVFGRRKTLVAGSGSGLLSLTLATLLVLTPPGWFWRRYGGALLSLIGAFLLLIPMLHSMLFVTFVDPGEAPQEMLSYVQTTPDVTLVMSKIETLDQELYHGQHQLKIGVDNDNVWPFAWYLRDYTCVGYGYPDNDPTAKVSCGGQGAYTPDVLLIDPGVMSQLYMSANPLYQAKEYRLRAWWDEGYKPLPPCDPGTAGCVLNLNGLLYGDGLGQWLSYGDNVPPGATFNAGKAASNLWAWLWTRKPIGSADGSTNFMFLVRTGLPVTP